MSKPRKKADLLTRPTGSSGSASQSLVRLTELVAKLFHQCQLDLAPRYRKDLGRPEIGALLAAAGEPRAISDIARQLGISRQAAHVAVRNLDASGLVKCTRHPEDARIVLVSASRTGAKVIDSLDVALSNALRDEPLFKALATRRPPTT